MVHTCNVLTDLDELIGTECWEGQRRLFHYGPLALAMKTGVELVLENSKVLSPFMLQKVSVTLGSLACLYIDDTTEVIQPNEGFRLTLR